METNDDLWRGYGLKKENLHDCMEAIHYTIAALDKPLRNAEELRRVSRWLRGIAEALDNIATKSD